jgi:hypothetical protein
VVRDDLEDADEAVLEVILDQGEKRLTAQCTFADAQDQRGSSIVNSATALAAAAVALAVSSAASSKAHTLGQMLSPLVTGSSVAALGFSVAAAIALWSLKSRGFHGCGYYPKDFTLDLHNKKSLEQIQKDFVLDLQLRLVENGKVLSARGQWFDWASRILIATPAVALVAATIVA